MHFLWCEVLKRPEVLVDLPRPKVPKRLPEILSREEVARLLGAAANLRNRTALMTAYAADLRVSVDAFSRARRSTRMFGSQHIAWLRIRGEITS